MEQTNTMRKPIKAFQIISTKRTIYMYIVLHLCVHTYHIFSLKKSFFARKTRRSGLKEDNHNETQRNPTAMIERQHHPYTRPYTTAGVKLGMYTVTAIDSFTIVFECDMGGEEQFGSVGPPSLSPAPSSGSCSDGMDTLGEVR